MSLCAVGGLAHRRGGEGQDLLGPLVLGDLDGVGDELMQALDCPSVPIVPSS
jgi:hypothetical protein